VVGDPPYRVCIDAGHGGSDPGARGVVEEKEMTAQTSEALLALLEINADPVGRVAHHRPERLFPALISPGAEQRCFPKEKCCTEADDTHQKADDRRSGRAALSSPACVSWI